MSTYDAMDPILVKLIALEISWSTDRGMRDGAVVFRNEAILSQQAIRVRRQPNCGPGLLVKP